MTNRLLDRRDLTYQFSDVAGLLNFVHGLSQWIYAQPDAEVRDPLIEMLYATPPRITVGTGVPLYLSLPAESAEWPVQPGAADGAELVPMLPLNVRALTWTQLALLLALEPTSTVPRRDDLVFLVQGDRSDLLAILDAVFSLEQEHSEDLQLLLAPVNVPHSANSADGDLMPDSSWLLTNEPPPTSVSLAYMIKVSGLRRFYLLEKTATDPRLRLFYRHVFPPYVPVPPGLQLYVEWGYRYPLPPASFIMDAWQRDKLNLALLAAPGRGEPLIVPPEVVFRPVLQVAADIHLIDSAESASLQPLTAPPDSKPLDVELRLQKRPVGDLRENAEVLRHQIQNDLWRLQRILAREHQVGVRRLYAYADDNPREISILRDFVLANPLAVLNEFKYFCGRFRERVYHLLLLPAEDGTSVITPDRYPDTPTPDRIFRREPSWAAQPAGHELYLPRDLELYPPLAPGAEGQEDILKRVLGLVPEYNYESGKILALLWPDQDGALVNFHVPLEAFVSLSDSAGSLNTQLVTPDIAQAITAQIGAGLRASLQPDSISGDVLALREQVTETYRSAWEVARHDLERLLGYGLEAEKVAKSVRARFGLIKATADQQTSDWLAFLQEVVSLAEIIDRESGRREQEVDQKQAALIARLQTQIEKDHIKQLRDKFDQVAEAVRNVDSLEKRGEIAGMLESLAAEIRSGGGSA